MIESLEEFKKKAKNVSGHRKHRVTKSLGVKAGYTYYRKHKPEDKKYIISEGQYYKIIRLCNKAIRDAVIKGHSVMLPCRMGVIELIKKPAGVYFKDGKLVNTMPIDWDSTLELWHEDKDAYDKRQLVRLKERQVFTITYSRRNAFYKNSFFYSFNPNREFKLLLKAAVKEGNVDSFILY